mmetsp:Transcript_9996/g.14137  ORF Transcript_9996/g.14137 Transcript_9996/m.14137 type:complete len:372 (+) Transcript_9996:51-1166(+)
MMRPGDQAKLFFFYLLRTSAALATSEPPLAKVAAAKVTPTTSTPHSAAPTRTTSNPNPILDGYIHLRVARKADVSSIQRCNLETLPENYSQNFYSNHMRQWPDLALVAEHVPSNLEAAMAKKKKKQFPMNGYDPNNPDLQSNIVGYVLGKVEQFPVEHGSSTRPIIGPSVVLGSDDDDERLLRHMMEINKPPEMETLGHVTSLAVLQPYRRRGLAAMLMNQLHYHMRCQYNPSGVGLHVRVSNNAARRLYCEEMGYKVKDVISAYYQDGEDAYLMRKDFNDEDLFLGNNNSPNDLKHQDDKSRQSTIGKMRTRWNHLSAPWGGGNKGNRVWESGPKELRLPKIIPLLPNNHEQYVDVPSTSSQSKVMNESL